MNGILSTGRKKAGRFWRPARTGTLGSKRTLARSAHMGSTVVPAHTGSSGSTRTSVRIPTLGYKVIPARSLLWISPHGWLARTPWIPRAHGLTTNWLHYKQLSFSVKSPRAVYRTVAENFAVRTPVIFFISPSISRSVSVRSSERNGRRKVMLWLPSPIPLPW